MKEVNGAKGLDLVYDYNRHRDANICGDKKYCEISGQKVPYNPYIYQLFHLLE